MLDSVLRVFGGEFDVESFLSKNALDIEVDSFIKGMPDLLGSPNLESGFDALISENTEPEQHLIEVQHFLEAHKAKWLNLKQQGVKCVLDIGCSLGIHDEFAQGLTLSSEFLGLCHELHISIEFSIYPSQAQTPSLEAGV
jgi:hypothetical protein